MVGQIGLSDVLWPVLCRRSSWNIRSVLACRIDILKRSHGETVGDGSAIRRIAEGGGPVIKESESAGSLEYVRRRPPDEYLV